MLDNATKRKIDSARQILVGKVPDPKAQVEQITTALVYKFMDDMDKESEELGGEARFFANGFSQYSWTKLMDNRLSGQERLELYAEAIANMSKNPHIPQLFRDIFKGAFLPFRDPRTLSLFLKEINEFNYDHSENLGNAFEYLLSILGSQGDAGQFRTPRHIIDFIVEVVNPQKNETILDPACGTAGFLISAYKHILKTNSSNFKPEEEKAEDKIVQGETATETIIEEKTHYSGDLLSPDDKTKLTQNIAGYDISPDMVKLALVNLYLHGFSDPKIFEYDTLSSDKRWGETFDVILANPPFMTPKGGISPHGKFSVQSSRSEVLFVDYILEHLSINGRAGIIVPEGIIFQTGKSYVSLREMLINKGLWCVVSLPVGVFNPYTKTTKTSILFIDKKIQTKNKEILFLKVNQDGFDLGAERFAIKMNDLPSAIEATENFKANKSITTNLDIKKIAIKKLEERKNLNFAIFNEVEDDLDSNYNNIEIGKILKQIKNKITLEDSQEYKQITVKMNGKGVILRKTIRGNEVKTKTQFIASAGDFIMSKIDARNGAFGIVPKNLDKAIVTSDFPLFRVDENVMFPDFLNIVIQSPQFIKICQLTSIGTSNRRRIKLDKFLKSHIPLPSLEDQAKFLKKIKQYESDILELENQVNVLKEQVDDEIENIWTS